MLRLHDLDCIYDCLDEEEKPDPSLEEAHWLEMDYYGDESYFVETRLCNKIGEESFFFMSRKTAKRVRDFLNRVLS